MPKIKVKNISESARYKICDSYFCRASGGCPLYKAIPLDDGDVIHCARDSRYNPEDEIIELSEKDFPTNREWLESLSDEDLAAFYTNGVLIEKYSPYPINIHQIIGNFISSELGIKEWLSKPCIYLMEEE